MSLLLGIGISGFTGQANLTVAQPGIAAVGTEQDFLIGAAALAVPQPILAATGLLKFIGIAALPVTTPVMAASGLVTISITGTAALTVPAPVLNASGMVPVTTPPGVGGRPRRAVIHQYPTKRRVLEPMYPVEMRDGEGVLAVHAPKIKARGLVEQPWEAEQDIAAVLAFEDDLELVLAAADAWMS